MFERYTEPARRAIFFAVYEAKRFGSTHIEPEHLLLGLLHDPQSLANKLFGLNAHADSLRLKMEQKYPSLNPRPKNGDLPLSDSGKRVLIHAAEEADRIGNPLIDTEHMLLGLLCEKESHAAKLLSEVGVELASARHIVAPPAGHTPDST